MYESKFGDDHTEVRRGSVRVDDHLLHDELEEKEAAWSTVDGIVFPLVHHLELSRFGERLGQANDRAEKSLCA